MPVRHECCENRGSGIDSYAGDPGQHAQPDHSYIKPLIRKRKNSANTRNLYLMDSALSAREPGHELRFIHLLALRNVLKVVGRRGADVDLNKAIRR